MEFHPVFFVTGQDVFSILFVGVVLVIIGCVWAWAAVTEWWRRRKALHDETGR